MNNDGNAIVVEDWSVQYLSVDPYMASELAGVGLFGSIEGDGVKKIITQKEVKRIRGRFIETHNGNLYWLGDPEHGYRKWLAENRPHWDPESPIKSVGFGEEK